MSTSTPRQVKCPQCGKMTIYSPENASRPFCSERCRLIDLGAWADENYKIPTRSPDGNSSSDALTEEDIESSDHDDDLN